MENLEKEKLENVEEQKEESTQEIQEQDSVAQDSIQLEEVNESEEQKEEVQELPPMEAVVEVETTYDYRTFKYCHMYIIRVKKKSVLVYSIMAAICFIVGLVCFFTMEGLNKYISLIIIALGFWTIKNIFTEESKIDKNLENFFRTHAPFKQSFAFDSERIRVTAYVDGEVKQADYPWPYIQEIHAIPEFFILFLNGGTPIVIDRDESKLLKGTKEDLEQVIREQSVLKPFNSYNKPFFKHLKDITYYVEPTVEEKNKEDSNNEE